MRLRIVTLGLLSAAFSAFAQNGSAAVEGQVVNAITNAPVRRASVNLRSMGPVRATRPGEPPAALNLSYDAETDDQGRFAFQGLEAGRYQVTVQRQGYVSTNSSSLGMQTSQLYLGESQKLINFVIRISAQAVIAGRVTDSFGDPVMGSMVTVYRAVNGGIGSNVTGVTSVQTNDLGEYRLANLPPGEYVVSAAPSNRGGMASSPLNTAQPLPDRPAPVNALTYYPSAVDPAAASKVKVDVGAEIRNIDIKMARVDGWVIRGKLVDADGAPAGPASVMLRKPGALTSAATFGSGASDGSFTIRGVPSGAYTLLAQVLSPGVSNGPTASGTLSLEVADKNLDGVVVQVRRPLELQGTVKRDAAGQCDPRGSNLTVGSPDGGYYGSNPQPTTIGNDLKFTVKSITPGSWAFSLSPMAAQCYIKSIQYLSKEYVDGVVPITAPGTLELTISSGMGTVDVTLLDRDGKPAAVGTVSYVPHSAPRSSTRSSTTGMQGSRLTSISLQPGTYDVIAYEQGYPSYIPPADLIKLFPKDAKTVTVSENTRASIQLTVIPKSELGGDAALPPPIVPVKGSLSGQVVNSVTGAPLAGINVNVSSRIVAANTPATQLSIQTDAQGRFAFRDLQPGYYNPIAQAIGFITAGVTAEGMAYTPSQIVVGEGQDVAGVVLKLAPQAVISGKVTDDSGQPLLRAQVTLYRYVTTLNLRALSVFRSVDSDDLGVYRITMLPPGEYFVRVSRRDVNPAPAAVLDQPLPAGPETGYGMAWYPKGAEQNGASAVKVEAGAEATDINLTLPKTHVVRIRGVVVDPAGPLGTAPVLQLIPRDSGPNGVAGGLLIGNAVAAADGRFEISGVPEGAYWLMARPGPMRPAGGAVGSGPAIGVLAAAVGVAGGANLMAAQSVDVKDSPIEGIKLELSRGRDLAGAVVGENGNPVRQCINLYFSSSMGMAGMGSQNCQTGKFTVRNVRPIFYSVSTSSQSLSANIYLKSIRYAGKTFPSSEIEFTGEGDIEIVVGTKAAILEGSVVDRDGKPVGAASIVIAPADGSDLISGNADFKGQFYFANLKPGEYRVYAWAGAAPENIVSAASLAPFSSSAKRLTLADNAREKTQLSAMAP